MGTAVGRTLRIDAPSAEDLASFHRDGYVAFSSVFTDEGLEGITDEILRQPQVVAYLGMAEEERRRLDRPYRLGVRNWDDKEYWSDQLIDAPLVGALLQAISSEGFHFCHSTLHLTLRGAPAIPYHQDHHHWKHSNPLNIAERGRWYIQMLYYPNGFTLGDASVSVIPGSHRVDEVPGVTPEKLLAGAHDEEAGRRLEERHLELPPSSMVFLNARCFHAVAPKPADSPQEIRIFFNYIFKEVGPPHRFTQPIPPAWLEKASVSRRRLFEREAFAPEIWPLSPV